MHHSSTHLNTTDLPSLFSDEGSVAHWPQHGHKRYSRFPGNAARTVVQSPSIRPGRSWLDLPLGDRGRMHQVIAMWCGDEKIKQIHHKWQRMDDVGWSRMIWGADVNPLMRHHAFTSHVQFQVAVGHNEKTSACDVITNYGTKNVSTDICGMIMTYQLCTTNTKPILSPWDDYISS